MSIHEELNRIQRELKAPKAQRNTFGKYNYRSCEDIIEAYKAVAGDTALTISDDIRLVGDRIYVEAIASLGNGSESITVRAFAREASDKKGMDSAQITGAASSYARKYALNGLFAIDDTKDADATNDHGQKESEHSKAVRENAISIAAIKEGISSGEYSGAAEAWFELDDETKKALWVAPSNGGVFTTEERKIIHSGEFREALTGEAS